MTWLLNLYKTYENNLQQVGEFEKRRNGQEYALIPIAHTTQSAHIEVALNSKGNFVSAKVIEKNDSSTIIPCTEASSSRTSAPVPHPLFDKLPYVAGDYMAYGGIEKKATLFTDYMTQLSGWCNSPYAHSKVKTVYTYLQKGTLIEDLIKEKVVYVDENNQFIEKWNKSMEDKYGEKPELYKVIAGDQSEAFVRFSVNVIGDVESRLWRDPTIHESFVSFYEGTLQEIDLCYVTGERLPATERHASRIRHSADMSKLISSNDTSGFTFRGRFKNSKDAASISYEVSQKAHNALKWLIAKQGYSIDGKVFLVWGTEELEMLDPNDDTDDLYGDTENGSSGDMTHKEFANQLKKAIDGYRNDLDYNSDVIILVLDAATPGRMAVVYYRDMNKELFLNRLQNWHQTCCWLHRYKKDHDKKTVEFIGAPATKDIAFAAYGSRASDKLVKGLIERMLPSIIDGQRIPRDIVRSAFQRASNPVGMDKWEWEKTLSITCALLNKTYEEEALDVSLDVNNSNRDYLFGRLLAIADVLERSALDNEEKRATNAVRYMNAFAQRPSRTWTIIQSNIQPYQAKLGNQVRYFNSLIDEVGSKLNSKEFTDKPLSGLYLLGFYSQRHELYKSKKEKEADQEQTQKGES